MVKRWGKSPPRTWQQGRHGKPHPEQCRIGASGGQSGNGRHRRDASARRPGLAAKARRQRRDQRNGHPGGFGPRTEPGLQAVRAYSAAEMSRPRRHAFCLRSAQCAVPRDGPARGIPARKRKKLPRCGFSAGRQAAGRHAVRGGAFAVDSAALAGKRRTSRISPGAAVPGLLEKRLWRNRRPSRSV